MAFSITTVTARAPSGVRNPVARESPPPNSAAASPQAIRNGARYARLLTMPAVPLIPGPPHQPKSFCAPCAAMIEPTAMRKRRSPDDISCLLQSTAQIKRPERAGIPRRALFEAAMPGVRLELTRPCGQRILSPSRQAAPTCASRKLPAKRMSSPCDKPLRSVADRGKLVRARYAQLALNKGWAAAHLGRSESQVPGRGVTRRQDRGLLRPW